MRVVWQKGDDEFLVRFVNLTTFDQVTLDMISYTILDDLSQQK